MRVIDRLFNVLYMGTDISYLNKLQTKLEDEFSNIFIEMCDTLKEAISIIKSKPFDVIIACNKFPDYTGSDFLEQIRYSGNVTPFILLVEEKKLSIYSKAFKLGVDDIILRGNDIDITCLEIKNSFNRIINFSNEVHKRITETKSIEDAYTFQTKELEKRLWESNFLYSMPKIIDDLDKSKKESFLNIINLIKETWKNTNILSVRIFYKGDEFKTDNFKVTDWKQSSEIIAFGEEIGLIEVYYKNSSLRIYENKFLLEAVAREISKVSERISKTTEIKKLSRAVEQSPSVIILADIEGRIEWVNPRFIKVTGYSLDEISGSKIPDICNNQIFSQNEAFYKLVWKTITKGNIWKGELLIKKKSGVFYWALTSISPIRDDRGYVTHFVIIQEDITELKKLIKALNKSEERNKAYIRAIPDLMLRVDRYGIIFDILIPEGFSVNITPNNVKNKQFFDVFQPNIASILSKSVNMAFKTGRSQLLELNMSNEWTKNISRFFEARSVISGADEALIILRDVTDKKQAEETIFLKEAKNKIEIIVNTIADGVLVLDPKGNIFLVNQSFKNLYYYIFNKSLSDEWNCTLNTGHIFYNTINKLFSKNGVQTISIEPMEDFHIQIISTKIQTLDLEGYLIITIQDITTFVKFERIVKQFISTASHELRTPVSVIIQSLSNLKKYGKTMSENVKEKLMESLYRNANLMYELVDNLLLISRIDEKRIKLACTDFSPNKILHQVLNQLELKQKLKDVKISNNVGENIRSYGDPIRIAQVFRILIDNAIKYSNECGKVIINAFDNYYGLYNPDNIHGILFEFIDEGIGIRKMDQSRIFDRFFRSEEVKNLPGTGLGLSIAKEIITLHGGSIFLESKYGKGSSFFIFLPKSSLSDNRIN